MGLPSVTIPRTAVAKTQREARCDYPALTGIRFPLAIWVVAYHLSATGQLWQNARNVPLLNTFVGNAYVALGTFFALSGFLLSQGYSNVRWNRTTLGRYAAARFGRVYPLYLFSLLVVAPIMLEGLRRPDLGGAGAKAGIVANYLLLLQGWARPPVDWNTPAWSLSCEIFFYALFPIFVVLLGRRSWRSIAIAGALAFGVPIAVHALGLPEEWKPITYLGDFIAGIGVAKLMQIAPRVRRVPGQCLYLPAAAAGLAIILAGVHDRSWMFFDESMRCVNVLIVLGMALGGGRLHRLLSSKWAVAGGETSYGIYILHIPVLWWFSRYCSGTAVPDPALGVAYLSVVIAVAWAAGRWIEQPANALIRRKLGRSSPHPRPAHRTPPRPSFSERETEPVFCIYPSCGDSAGS